MLFVGEISHTSRTRFQNDQLNQVSRTGYMSRLLTCEFDSLLAAYCGHLFTVLKVELAVTSNIAINPFADIYRADKEHWPHVYDST